MLVAWNGSRLEGKRQRIESLRLQIRELYGPLQFFTSSNAKLFELYDKFQIAYKKEYIEQQWSEEEITQERVGEASVQTLGIANQYIDQVMANNDRILSILESNYSLIEPDDIEVFMQFVVDLTRLKVETDEAGRTKTPLKIYEQIGDISFMRKEFIETVNRRFQGKKAEVDKLVGR